MITRPKGGMFAAAQTIFDAEGRLDWEAWAAHLAWLCDGGLDGVLIMGTTGEFPLLSLEEKLRAVGVAKEAVPEGHRLMVNVGSMTTVESVRLAEASAEGPRPADMLLCGPPYYFQSALTPERFHAHFRAIAQATALPFLYYHIPKMMHFAPSVELLSETIREAPLLGIKDSDGVLDFQREVQARHPASEFVYFSGSPRASLPSWEASGEIDGSGAIFGVASAMPAECAAFRSEWTDGHAEEAASLHKRLSAVWDVTSKFGIPGARALLGLMNLQFAGRRSRAPFGPISEAETESISEALRENGFSAGD